MPGDAMPPGRKHCDMNETAIPTSSDAAPADSKVNGGLRLSMPRTAAPPPKIRWGEELPIFCEACGYSLNGLGQNRCGECDVLHFACPECNHHQPINTLRPAFQRTLGRLRALGLAL